MSLERWHPLTVHFPIGFLLLGTAIFITYLITRNRMWLFFTVLLLVIGSLGSWISVWTGHLADGVVARHLCDPGVLKDHENYNIIATWMFSGAAVLSLFRWMRNTSAVLTKTLHMSVLLLCLSASGLLVYGAHLGGKLVYEQGAGVFKPKQDCSNYD